MLRPWAQHGHECIAVDLQHPAGERIGDDGIRRVGCDVRDYPATDRPAIVFAFPPCTDLAVSGARWFRQKGPEVLSRALEIVHACRRIAERSGARWMIENPVGRLSSAWRKPDYIFHPHEYAGYLTDPRPDQYTKKTCLWVGSWFQMPPKRSLPPVLGSKMHTMAPGPERANLRSVTPAGFAQAVFEANAWLVS